MNTATPQSTSTPPVNLSELHDSDLVERWQDGDDRALKVLLDRNLETLRRHLTRRFGEEVAEEATSKVLYKLARGVKYEHRGHFRAWLQTVGRRAAIDVVRRNQRIRKLADQAEAEPRKLFVTHGGDRAIRNAEKSKKLESYLSELPTLHRTAVKMRYWSGFSTDDIAQSLQLSAGQVRDRLAYALRALRRKMPDQTF